jgi:hypothetical protein
MEGRENLNTIVNFIYYHLINLIIIIIIKLKYIIAIYFPPSWFTFIYVQEQLVIVIIETTFSRYLSFFFFN